MTPHEVRGPGRPAARGEPHLPVRRLSRAGLVLAAGLLVLVGCSSATSSSAGATPPGGASPIATTTAAPSGTAPSAPAQSQAATTADVIPPGRKVADGSGGPPTYTFREEWRKALVTAQAWRGSAFLISAAGDMVNDDGIPSHWTCIFLDAPKAQTILIVEIDPWGVIGPTREITGDDASSFVDASALRIPYAVIDSDTAVATGKTAVAAQLDLATTKEPRIALGFSITDGTGPFWTYSVFRKTTAEYVAARLDALTGAVISVK
jgi:hypothetical protein